MIGSDDLRGVVRDLVHAERVDEAQVLVARRDEGLVVGERVLRAIDEPLDVGRELWVRFEEAEDDAEENEAEERLSATRDRVRSLDLARVVLARLESGELHEATSSVV